MTIKVHVAGHLRDRAGGTDVELERARDVLDVVNQLEGKIPGFKDRVMDEHDRTRQYINIFVNDEEARSLKAEHTETRDGDVIYILPSVAGGKSR